MEKSSMIQAVIFLILTTTISHVVAVNNTTTTTTRYCGRPQLNLTYTLKDGGGSAMVTTCVLLCDPKFTPDITVIPCGHARECDDLRPCLDKIYRDKNKDICWKDALEGSPELEYKTQGMTGMVQCKDKGNPSLSSTDYILKPDFITGRDTPRETLLAGGPRAELITVTHGEGTTPHNIYQNGTRVFYRGADEKVFATPSRFFFDGKCDWTLRHEDGLAVELYRERSQDVAQTREIVHFRVPNDPATLTCSVKWYNTTQRLEKQFRFVVIDPLLALAKPTIDKSVKNMKFDGFHKPHKIGCVFSGGDGEVKWFSHNQTFNNGSSESYRNLLSGVATGSGDKIESVKEVRFVATNYLKGFTEDQVTCVVTNSFGSDSHTIAITKMSVSDSNCVQLSSLVLLSFIASFIF